MTPKEVEDALTAHMKSHYNTNAFTVKAEGDMQAPGTVRFTIELRGKDAEINTVFFSNKYAVLESHWYKIGKHVINGELNYSNLLKSMLKNITAEELLAKNAELTRIAELATKQVARQREAEVA